MRASFPDGEGTLDRPEGPNGIESFVAARSTARNESANDHIEERSEDQPEESDAEHSGEHGDTHDVAHLGARATREHQRHHTHDEGEGGHENWTETDAARLEGSAEP